VRRDERYRTDKNHQKDKKPKAALVKDVRQGTALRTDTHRDFSLGL
jgi:hypothetical protein